MVAIFCPFDLRPAFFLFRFDSKSIHIIFSVHFDILTLSFVNFNLLFYPILFYNRPREHFRQTEKSMGRRSQGVSDDRPP